MKALDEELKKLVAYCRKNGVQGLKMDGVEINLHPSAFFPESAYKQKKKQADTQSDHIPTEGAFSEEDALFWSSAGIPESGAQ